MLTKVPGLGGLFSQKNEHPLADPRELRQLLAELPADNAFRALDEITGWLESLLAAEGFPADRVYDAARQLEDVALPHLKRLSREYLHSARLNRSDEKRLWSINYGFWALLAAAYERCLLASTTTPKLEETFRPLLPALTTRLIAALGAILKWEQFHYGPTVGELWLRLGQALAVAERNGVATKLVPLRPMSGTTCAQNEYLKALVFQAASMDSLLPLEIEVAERLIAHFLPAFVFGNVAHEDSVYWVDLRLPQPPLRMARMPALAEPSQRFFKPADANKAMLALLHGLERGGDVPADINLGDQYNPRLLMPVLRHLAAYLAPIPPQRRHDRHRVKHRMSVLSGVINAFVVFSGEFGGRPAGLQMESWVVENVSRGGFGALLESIPAEWLKVGALIAMQPEGGDNWLLGIVRRYHRENDNEARVGIETIARQAVAEELVPRTTSSYAAVAGIPSLIITEGGEPGEVRLVMPHASFDLRESLEYTRGGKRQLLLPVALLEQTTEYELARYRISPSA